MVNIVLKKTIQITMSLSHFDGEQAGRNFSLQSCVKENTIIDDAKE